jgi:ubiquinone/menaquinone biosynthesis C-methylase UbiE
VATVFMKWLETTPADYERGIQLLTLGRIREVRERIATRFVQAGDHVLDLGCGTGNLAILCARRGAQVTGIDASPAMLDVARQRVEAEGLEEQIELRLMDATTVTDHFPEKSFDVVVSTLALSELSEDGLPYVLDECQRLLKDDGWLVVADEAVPQGLLARIAFYALRLPLAVLTWLITRTTTTALRGFEDKLRVAGFRGREVEAHLGGSLKLFAARKEVATEAVAPHAIPRLVHRVTPWRVLKDLWCLLMRNIPPYPSVRPGLYAVGQPHRGAPVLVTANYDLTVRRVVRDIQGLDAYLLVADSRGINVWCGAGGGHFTAQKVIAAVKTSGLEGLVDHHTLILPQLCANGVKGSRIEEETGWRVRWGPVYARDIPAYLAHGQRKTDAMRGVRFPLKDRLEMAVVTWQFWALLVAVVLAFVRRDLLVPTLISSLALFLFTGATYPWLPGRDGFWKGVSLAGLTVVATIVGSQVFAPLGLRGLIRWSLGLGGLALFAGADYQGAAPTMRSGEAEHFPRLALIGLVILAVYVLLPRVGI